MDSTYSAGELRLDILGYSENAIASIDKTVKSLNALSRSITKLNGTQTAFAGEQLNLLFKNIAKATNSINTQNLDHLASAAKSISNISKLDKLEKIDYNKVGQGFQKMAVDIKPFLNEVMKAETSLNSLYGITQKMGTIKKVNQKPDKENRSVSSLFNLAKMTGVIYSAKRLGGIVANIAQSGADFTETLNLWQVAMGNDLIPRATEFVNKMSEAYGISKQTLMNAQATYKNMLGTLGNISDEMAYSLSEAVMKMSIDYASLYNVSIEQATQKFQAALAGQVRPIRSISGYDITENTLYQLYQSIGGTKSIRQLNQTEKRLLSIYAIFKQMETSGAIYDMERTINSFANQSRILAENFREIEQYSGVLLTNMLDSFGVLTYINAVLTYISGVLNAMAIASDAFSKDGGVFSTTTESANDASKAIDEVNGKLLGFDKIRSLQGNEEKDVMIDKVLAEAIGSYNSSIDDSLLKSNEIARVWLENVGIIYDNTNGTYKLTKKFESLKDVLNIVSSLLVGISAYLGVKGILSIAPKLVSLFSKLGITMTKAFDLKILGIVALISALYYMYTTNEDFKESVDNLFSVLFDAIGTVAEPFSELLSIIASVLAEILDILAPMISDVADLITYIFNLAKESGFLEEVLWTILGVVALYKMNSWMASLSHISDKLGVLNGILKKLGDTAYVTQTIGIGALFIGIQGIVSIFKNWDSLSTLQKVIGLLGGLTVAALGAAMAFGVFHSAWSLGLAAAGIVAGIAAISAVISSSQKDIIKNGIFKNIDLPKYANGGLPDKGSLFIAGEAGAELLYNMPNGQSGVANIQQVAQATYNGTIKALNDWWGGSQAKSDIPQLQEANATGMYQAVTGVARSYGEKWTKY